MTDAGREWLGPLGFLSFFGKEPASMRKLDLRSYKVALTNSDTGQLVEKPYDCRLSLRVILMNPQLQLNASELLQHSDLSDKIQKADDEIILEEAEYSLLTAALDKLRGFTQNDVELVRRVKSSHQVTVKEAQ